jgi:hypothetical protein
MTARAPHAPRSLPARHPPNGAWPAEMRADMAAAFLGYETTGRLIAAIVRGEAPRPTATRLRDGKREPVWAKVAIDAFLANRHKIVSDVSSATKRLGDLI